VTFDHPWLAWGVLASLIPPLLHLFDRRKARPQAFAAMDFLLRAKRSGARNLRLRRILLMAARMALLAAVPLALARPHRVAKAAVISSAPNGPHATVLLLDASGSMRYRHPSVSLFREAQDAARRRLQELESDEPVSVQICEARGKPPGLPGFDRLAARAAIDQAQPSAEPADIGLCLEAAAQALAQSELPAKRIAVFTDLTAAGWDLSRPAPQIQTSRGPVKPEVEVVDVAHGPLPNLALSDLTIEASSAVGPHGYQISFLVHNFSDRPVQNVPIYLKADGSTVARGFADLASMGTERKVLAASFEPGTVVKGQVELQMDSLTEDDVLPFLLVVPRQARVLIVDGAASSLRYLDEAFFTQTALQATEGAIQMRTLDPETLAPADLGGPTASVDAVLLLNVHALSKELAAALRRYVEKGGGLFVTLGDKVDPDVLNDTLGALLPAPLRLVKTAAIPPKEAATGAPVPKGSITGQGPAHFAQVDYGSPIFALFTGATREGLLEAQFYRYVLVESPPPDVHVLAAYDDGSPAILSARRGSGHVVLFTSSVAREWTDWPIRVSFVPIVQQIVLGLAGIGESKPRSPDLVGSTHVFPTTDVPPSTVVSPSGAELPVVMASGGATVGPLSELGIYRAKVKGGTAETSASMDFSVTFDPRESDTRRLEQPELAARYGAKISTEGTGVDEERRKLPLWTELLAAAALLFLAESLLLG
jgi:hypothetical protein